jgi:hypothetical protein
VTHVCCIRNSSLPARDVIDSFLARDPHNGDPQIEKYTLCKIYLIDSSGRNENTNAACVFYNPVGWTHTPPSLSLSLSNCVLQLPPYVSTAIKYTEVHTQVHMGLVIKTACYTEMYNYNHIPFYTVTSVVKVDTD